MKDPLAGKRRDIMARKITVLVWPAVNDNGVTVPAPVEKGQRFDVSGVPVIEIEKVTRKFPAGRKAEWHATFIRHEVDRPQLLRRVPSGIPDGPDKVAGRSDMERARVESAYTSSPRQALVDEPESVGPDWEDAGRADREIRRQENRREVRAEDVAKEEIRRFKARVSHVCGELGKNGHDLTPLLNSIYERLAEIERETRDAA